MRSPWWRWLIALILGGSILWAYWPLLADMAERWTDDPQYSHGYFVPAFAAFLLWLRRGQLRGLRVAPSWLGVGVMAAGVVVWAAGTYLFLNWFAALSLLCCLAGLALVLGGVPALKWSWPSILFLAFMIPLPYRVQTALGGGLQRVAAVASTYVLQTCGAPAIREGNVILVNDAKIGVVEACSGLGMLVTFFALATAIAMLLRHSDRWLRLVMVASAVPVAVLANVARISATGLLYGASQDRLAQIVFHDVAGWLMMPLAIVTLFAELQVLKRLVVAQPALDAADGALFGLPGPGPESASVRLPATPPARTPEKPKRKAAAGGRF